MIFAKEDIPLKTLSSEASPIEVIYAKISIKITFKIIWMH